MLNNTADNLVSNSTISSLSITYLIIKLSYGKEIHGLLWQEVDSENSAISSLSITYHTMKLSYGKEIRSLVSLRKTAGARTSAFQYTHHIQKPQNTQYSRHQLLNTQNPNSPKIENSKDLIS